MCCLHREERVNFCDYRRSQDVSLRWSHQGSKHIVTPSALRICSLRLKVLVMTILPAVLAWIEWCLFWKPSMTSRLAIFPAAWGPKYIDWPIFLHSVFAFCRRFFPLEVKFLLPRLRSCPHSLALAHLSQWDRTYESCDCVRPARRSPRTSSVRSLWWIISYYHPMPTVVILCSAWKCGVFCSAASLSWITKCTQSWAGWKRSFSCAPPFANCELWLWLVIWNIWRSSSESSSEKWEQRSFPWLFLSFRNRFKSLFHEKLESSLITAAYILLF